MKAACSIAFALLLAVSGLSFAQPPTAEDATARWEKLAQTLGLDSTQTDTFLSVMNAQDTKMRSYHEEMKTKMDTLRGETLSELGDTLSANQLEKLKTALAPPERGTRRF
jgi:Skp family chaperone for outer membrane proteins